MKIVLPALILGILALLFSILLAVLGKKLAVVNDERVDKIRPLLTGANCGGCGQAGCEAFAKALVEGKAKISDCPSTKKENKQLIAEILGSEVGDVEETIVVCSCNGGNKCKDKYDYQGYGDCASIELLAGGRKACPVGCIGSNRCAISCPYHAIAVNDEGVAIIDQEKCKQCGICTSVCPKHLITRIPKKAKLYLACSNHDKGKDVRSICSAGCIGCGLCAKNCPEQAITLVDGLPKIDYDKCTGCFTCIEKCPIKCLKKL